MIAGAARVRRMVVVREEDDRVHRSGRSFDCGGIAVFQGRILRCGPVVLTALVPKLELGNEAIQG
jgi:hypothetical protein